MRDEIEVERGGQNQATCSFRGCVCRGRECVRFRDWSKFIVSGKNQEHTNIYTTKDFFATREAWNEQKRFI